MSPHPSRVRFSALLLAGATFIAASASAQTIGFTPLTAGPFDYNLPSNWVGGNINGIWDPALVQTANQVVTFSGNTALSTGLTFSYGGNVDETLRADGTGPYTLTLGGDVLLNTANFRTVTIGSSTTNQSLNVDLGGTTRTFTVFGGGNGGNFARTLVFANSVTNGGIVISGGNTGGGRVSFNALTNNFTSTTVRDAELAFNGSASANTVETIGALTGGGGTSQITLAPNSGRHVLVNASSFSRNNGSTILFRGNNLGVSTTASATANSANISFSSGPALSGGGGGAGTSTISILAGAYGDTTSAGTGFGPTAGLLTYDANNGLRLLAASEYTNVITNGQTQLDNVKLSNSSGSIATTTLAAATTTINSLTLDVSGATGNQGITINGSGSNTLKIESGVIYANQNVTGTNSATTDAMTLGSGLTLDLNGKEGIIFVNTKMNTGGTVTSNGSLIINSAITNGTGLTIADAMGGSPGGVVILGGSAANTYTGNTTINGAAVQLNKSTANTFGNLVINLGYVYNTGNQIADTSNVEINAGILFLNQSNNSGSATNETINNLTIRGGQVSPGSGNGNTFNINGNLNSSGGAITVAANGKLNVLGTSSFSGGTVTVSTDTTGTTNSKATLSGPLNITNTALGAYTPFTLNAGNQAGRSGGQLVLSGDVTFTGNLTNSNTTTIAAPSGLGTLGSVALNGVRTFDIGDGAAAVDVTIQAPVVNGTPSGGLTKNGNGTLVLAGANTYTGGTVVNSGTLSVTGTLHDSGSLTVNGGAYLVGTNDTVGTVTLAGGSIGGSGTLTGSSYAVQSGTVTTTLGGSGSLTKSTAGTVVLSGNNTYTGTTTISGGRLLVNGALSGSSAVTVDNTGILGGSNGTVGAVTVNNGGSLAPGSSIGTLNSASVDLQSGSSLDLEINTGALTSDLLNVSGAFDITAGATLQFSLLGTDTLLSPGQSFTLVDYGSWNGGLFSGYADGSVFSLGLNYFQIDYDNGTALTLTTVAVPEPGTNILIAFALATLVIRRRRKVRRD